MSTQVKIHLEAESERERNEPGIQLVHNGSVRTSNNNSRMSSVRSEGLTAFTEFEVDSRSRCNDVMESSFNADVTAVRRSFRTQYRERQRKKALIEEIVKHIRQITHKLDESDGDKILQADWKIVAKILDRSLLVLFTVLVVASNAFMLLIYPLFQKKQ